MSHYEEEIELVQYFANVSPGDSASVETAKGIAYISRVAGLMFDGGLVDFELVAAIGTVLHKVNGDKETVDVIESREIDARSFVMGALFALDNESFAVLKKRISF